MRNSKSPDEYKNRTLIRFLAMDLFKTARLINCSHNEQLTNAYSFNTSATWLLFSLTCQASHYKVVSSRDIVVTAYNANPVRRSTS